MDLITHVEYSLPLAAFDDLPDFFCLEPVHPPQSIFAQPCCRKVWHLECLIHWYERSLDGTCPQCRAPLPDEVEQLVCLFDFPDAEDVVEADEDEEIIYSEDELEMRRLFSPDIDRQFHTFRIIMQTWRRLKESGHLREAFDLMLAHDVFRIWNLFQAFEALLEYPTNPGPWDRYMSNNTLEAATILATFESLEAVKSMRDGMGELVNQATDLMKSVLGEYDGHSFLAARLHDKFFSKSDIRVRIERQGVAFIFTYAPINPEYVRQLRATPATQDISAFEQEARNALRAALPGDRLWLKVKMTVSSSSVSGRIEAHPPGWMEDMINP